MKDEYIIINKTAIQKRIEELQKYVGSRRPSADEYAKMHIYREILSQSTPLISEIEKAYDAGKLDEELSKTFDNPKGRYISNLKLEFDMKLIKLQQDHYIIVDDSKIQEGDWMYLQQGNTPSTKQGEIARCEFADANNLGVIWKKITHSTQPLDTINGFPAFIVDGVQELLLQEVKELIGEVDVEKNMWYERNVQNPYSSDSLLHTGFNKGFELGYNQAIEDNKEKKYTKENLGYLLNLLTYDDLTEDEKIESCIEYIKDLLQ